MENPFKIQAGIIYFVSSCVLSFLLLLYHLFASLFNPVRLVLLGRIVVYGCTNTGPATVLTV
jgi:hypothetical protein